MAHVQILHLEDMDSFRAAIAAHGRVVIDAFADWCAPCKAVAPFYQSLADSYAGRITFFKLNAGEQREAIATLADFLGVSSLPTFLFVRDGNIVAADTVVGADRARLEAGVRRLAS